MQTGRISARILKSEYYPSGYLLDTVFASDVSPVWREIEFGLELLKKGVVWRVGNGNSILIFRDSWISRQSSLKVLSLKTWSRIRWVNQLMLPQAREWNVPLIEKLFHNFDAEEICKIKIPLNETEDHLAWNYEKNGIFTVRSAYRLGMNLKQQEEIVGSSRSISTGRENLWNLMWKAHVPHKVHIVAWRIATDSLPTKENKRRRTLEIDGICNICGIEKEDAHHAIVNCTKARALREKIREHWA